MTHDEMVEVVLAHKDGKKIECRERHRESIPWRSTREPMWNFEYFDYRITEPKWRDATVDDLKRLPLRCRWRNFDEEAWGHGLLDGYVYGKPCWWIVGGHRCRQCQVLDE